MRGRVLGWLKVQLDIALLIGPRAVADEPNAPAAGDGGEHGRERPAHLVDARDDGGDSLIDVAGHRARRIEHDHRVLVARIALVLLRGARGTIAGEAR